MKKIPGRSLLTILALSFLAAPADAGDAPPYSVPGVRGITIDGSSGDWGESGFRVEFLADPDGRALPADDFDVRFRLGWSSEGLLVLATVRDDRPAEHAEPSHLWRSDCIEIIVADRAGSDNRYQLVITSGADPVHGTVRTKFFDWRPEDRRAAALTARVAGRVVGEGYTVEALLPWKNLGITPETGRELGFQLVANDLDETTGEPESLRVGWFPALDPSNPANLHRIRLDERPGEPVLYRVEREIARGRCTFSVRGSGEMAGTKVEIRSGETLLSEGTMDLQDGRPGFFFSLLTPGGRDPWPRVEVLLGGRPAAFFEELPALDRILEKYVEAVGGKEAIARIRTRRLGGSLTHEFPGQDPPRTVLPAEVIAVVSDRWRLILKSSRGLQQMGFDGAHGWTQDADRILLDDHQARSRLAFLFNPQGAPHLHEYFPGLRLKGHVPSGGGGEYAVQSTDPGGAGQMLYFEAESGLLRRIGDTLKIQEYRRKDGILHPVRIVIAREGGTSTYALDDIETNARIESARFAVPDMGEAFPDAFEGLADSKVLPLLKDFPSRHEEMSVPCRDGRFLHDLIVRNRYRRGLEIGTFTGYSALWMGLALERTGGKLITIEYDPASGGKARGNLLKAGLGGVVDARIADAFAEIPGIEGEFDFVFIDAWKPDYRRFLDLVRGRVAAGGSIVAHNVTNGARDMQDFLAAIRNDPGLETTFHELSAEGISVSKVRPLPSPPRSLHAGDGPREVSRACGAEAPAGPEGPSGRGR